MQYILGIVSGICLLMMFNMLFTNTPLSRPNLEAWKAVANADETDRIEAYKRSAQKLGVAIKIGYPVPCPAGADYAARLGHKGIYIERAKADKADELTNGMFSELAALSR